ncbi:MAG: hypothetical protein HY751_08740 [Nitrospinae bacterium]|nr:hypothetical protein [Nitrospinota bacterium]
MDIKEIFFYLLGALTIALIANHYFELGIEALDNIEESLVSSGERGGGAIREIGGQSNGGDTDKNQSRECLSVRRRAGDARVMIRKNLEAAKKENDIVKARDLEDRIASLNEEERQACQ